MKMIFNEISEEEVRDFIANPDKMLEQNIILYSGKEYQVVALPKDERDEENGEIFLVAKFSDNSLESTLKISAEQFFHIFEYVLDSFEIKNPSQPNIIIKKYLK